MAFVWVSKAERGTFWKNRDGLFSLTNDSSMHRNQRQGSLSMNAQPKNDEDEQWLSRLRSLGMGPEDEFKLVAMREYIWRVSMRTSRESVADPSSLNDIIPLTQHGVTPQTVFFDKNQNASPPRRSSVSKVDNVKNGDHKPHTITDALLDASTTIENTPSSRRRHARSRSQARRDIGTSAIPRQLNIENLRGESSPILSPTGSSPGGPGSRGLSPPSSDAEQKAPGSRSSPAQDGLSTPIDPENPSVKTMALRMKRKSSAMSLLNRADATKADAAISMTSTNAIGKVDVPSQ
ncbi:Serine/threonine-protein kinase, partial [Elasticomyces elasticus]